MRTAQPIFLLSISLTPPAVPAAAAAAADQTPFEGGVFKVKLVLPSDYPSAPPKGARAPRTPRALAAWRAQLVLTLSAARAPAPHTGYFLTRIYHPNISKAGEICVNTLKKDWQSNLGIGHVLQVHMRVRSHDSSPRLLLTPRSLALSRPPLLSSLRSCAAC